MKKALIFILCCFLLSCSDTNNINLNKQVNIQCAWTYNAYYVVKKNFVTISESHDSTGTVFIQIPNIEYEEGDFIELQIYSLDTAGRRDNSYVTASIIVDGYKVRTSTNAGYSTVYY